MKEQRGLRRPAPPQQINSQITFMFLVGFVVIYIGSSYLQRSSFENLFSFYGSDAPGQLPNVLIPKPFGVHFFGDFLLPQWQSRLEDPWMLKDPNGPPITNYFPFTMAVFWLFSYISYWKSFTLFLVISLSLMLYPLTTILRRFSRLERVQLIAGSILLTGPMIASLDRGNIQLLLVGLCLMGVYQFSQKRFLWAGFLIGLAIGLKIYPILFLVLFVRGRKWKGLTVGFATALLSTLLPLYFYDLKVVGTLSSINQNVKLTDEIYLRQYLSYNNSIKGFLITIESMGIPFVSRLATYCFDHFALLAIILIFMACIIFLNSKIPTGEILLVCAALMCSLATFVAPYVLGVFFIAVFWLWKDSDQIPNWALLTYGWILAILLMPRGLPLRFWDAGFVASSPTYTSLLGGPCCLAIIILCFARHTNKNALRGILHLELFRDEAVIS